MLPQQSRQSGGETLPALLDCSHSPDKLGPFLLTSACSYWVFHLVCPFPFLNLATSCHPSRIISRVSCPLKLSLNTHTSILGDSCSLLHLLHASAMALLCVLLTYPSVSSARLTFSRTGNVVFHFCRLGAWNTASREMCMEYNEVLIMFCL